MANPILAVRPLGPPPWPTLDPFLFCVHHNDGYPKGNDDMGPAAPLTGRDLGMDFARKDGWSMYHGLTIPGFPAHPHRGFETVTLVRQGYIDHSDSLGATARFGQGDCQWMTAGKGIVHAEMFPLRERETDNPLELFQIWLNLPAADKMVDPYFTMMWSEDIPDLSFLDDQGRATEVAVVAGRLEHATAPAPPPNSWASRAEADLAILTLKLDPGAHFSLPAAQPGTNRTLYFFVGDRVTIGGRTLDQPSLVAVQPDVELAIVGGTQAVELLVLQGRPIGEPVARHGPFVMNTQDEIRQAFHDYRATRFGGWPWPSDAPVHDRAQGRFARHADGKVETKA